LPGPEFQGKPVKFGSIHLTDTAIVDTQHS
jgi:hypothetical protein